MPGGALRAIRIASGSGITETALRAWFAKLDLSLPSIDTHNRRTQLLAVDWEGPCYLKRHHLGEGYRLGRRFNNWLQQFFKDPARRGFAGSLALQAHGINTVTPLACWRCWHGWRGYDGYVLYRPVAGEQTGRDLQRAWEADPRGQAAAFEAYLRESGAFIARLHAAGLRHYDLASGNILITGPGGPDFALLDNDSVRQARLRWPRRWKTWQDLRSLKRLNLPAAERKIFVRAALGDRWSETWWARYRRWIWRR